MMISSLGGGGGGGTPLCKLYRYVPPHRISSLRSRLLEIVATRKNARERRSHACLPRARPFSLPPATSKPLLRGLRISGRVFAPFWSENEYTLHPFFFLESGMVFEGTSGVYERIYSFNSKWVRKTEEKYANSKWIWRVFEEFLCLSANLAK